MLNYCSQNLQVLNLDGNYFSPNSLVALNSILTSQVAPSKSLQVLSLKDCGLREVQDQIPLQIKALIDLLSTVKDSLVTLNLSFNFLGSYFWSNFPKMDRLEILDLRASIHSERILHQISEDCKIDQLFLHHSSLPTILTLSTI